MLNNIIVNNYLLFHISYKGGSKHKNWCMARVLSFLIRYFSNYYTLHRSDLAARAAPLDPRLLLLWFLTIGIGISDLRLKVLDT